MATYGTVAAVKQILQATTTTAWNADADARMGNLLALVSSHIERETGMVFGVDAAETVVVEDANPGPVLYLPKPIRSVTSITEEPDWSGVAWASGTLLTTADYRLSGRRTITGAYRTLTRIDGAWGGLYVIAGVWEDQHPTVPAEITYVANHVAAELFKKEQASPAGQIGPDGAVIPLRDAFKETEIKRVLCDWRVGPAVWAV